MNRWEMLALGWALGSLSTAFVLSWFTARDRSEVRQLRAANRTLGEDLERARRANIDAIAVGFEIASGDDDDIHPMPARSPQSMALAERSWQRINNPRKRGIVS